MKNRGTFSGGSNDAVVLFLEAPRRIQKDNKRKRKQHEEQK